MGVEARIRWQHPKYRLLTLAEFSPKIENTLLDIEMGEWVIGSALE